MMDSGDGVSPILPIYEGYALLHAILRFDLWSWPHRVPHVFPHRARLLLHHDSEREFVRDVK